MRRLLWAIPFIFFIQISPIGSLEVTAETSTTTSSSVPPCCDGGSQQWTSNSSTTVPRSSSFPTTRAIVGEPWYLAVTQYPQAKCNWCGPAVAYSFAKYFGKTYTQTQLATYSGAGLNPPAYCACGVNDAPCKGTDDLQSLLRYATGYSYSKYSYSATIGTASNLAAIAWDTIYYGNRPIAANTLEKFNEASYNFHTADGSSVIRAINGIKHYIAITGVSFSNLRLMDPAANSSSLGWQNTAATRMISASSLAQYFYEGRGIFK